MDTIRVYKEMLVTYNELALALTQMGFLDESSSEYFRYTNLKEKATILLKAKTPEEIVSKANLAGCSYQLYLQGILKHTDDLAKRIEKNRLPKKTKKPIAVPQ